MDLCLDDIAHGAELLVTARLGERVVGTVTYDRERSCVSQVWVHPQARRRGVAGALYDHVRDALGQPLEPSETLTREGAALWRSRGVDALRGGSRLVTGGRCADDDVFGRVDVTAEVEAWDAARRAPSP